MPLELDPAAPNDFDFIIGDWRVKHKRLNFRLANCLEWTDFEGQSSTTKILGGFGNLEENILNFPEPPSILVVEDCPSKSVHSKQLAKRKFNRLCLTRQSPMMKSKSISAAGSSFNGMCYFLYNFNRPVLAGCCRPVADTRSFCVSYNVFTRERY